MGVSGTPPGTVDFLDNGTALASVTLTDGQATFTVADLAPGSHTITANYSGDATFAASAMTINQTILLATTTTLSSNYGDPANPPPTQQSITFTARFKARAIRLPAPLSSWTMGRAWARQP